jgi:PKHD-type hydroxylase
MLLQIPSVLNEAQLQTLRKELAEADYEDGTATAGKVAREVKNNRQLPQASETSKRCAKLVVEALGRNAPFFSAALPHRIHGPVFNRYDGGMTYGDHVDNAIMGTPSMRTDVAATLFISAPEDYDGGELMVHDSYGAHRIKLAAGNLIVYPASSLHRVQAVTRGSRLAAVMWIQSMVRDATQRRMLFELDASLGALRKSGNAGERELNTLTSVYHNLIRMWAET